MSTLTLSSLRQSLTNYSMTGLSVPALVLLNVALVVLPMPAWLTSGRLPMPASTVP